MWLSPSYRIALTLISNVILLLSSATALSQITVSTTDVTGCKKSDGKATISVTTAATGFDFEFAVDGSFQSSGSFENLSAGNHVATVRDKNTQCSFSKNFTIKEAPNQIHVSISGFGTTEFCNNAKPPTITLAATASGGSGDYDYSWPGGTLVVSSSGRHSITVTDKKTGCKASLGGDVIFVPIICSRDPNDIVGPEGYNKGKMVSKFQPQPYMIHFENDPDFATAPAQVVKINHPVDSTVNILSVRLGDFGFGRFTFPVPANKTYYSARLDVKDSLGIVVDVTAGIDVDKKEVFWIFESKDPATGLPPANSKLGFLPVNDSTAIGEGYVTFTVKPSNKTVTGDTIHAQASIVFDINAPLATPKIFNTIDAVAPVSTMKPLPATTDSTIALKWSGHDEAKGSGVRDYTVYVSENGGAFSAYQSGVTDTSITFKRGNAYSYSFFTRATDNTGNQEALKNKGEVTIVSPGNEYYRSIITGSWNNISTWESSVDSITWKAASVIPTNASKNVTIRGVDTVTVNADITTDQTVVEPGGVLSVASGKTLTVLNNGLTLRSAADKTASIGQSEGAISGNVVVERFIAARPAWRLLTVPFSSSQTIKAGWQEGGVYKPGFGTHITGGAFADGFDQSASNFPSIKRYNQLNNSFDSLTSTLLPLTDQPGYMLFVRGDRSIDLSQGTPGVANNTILRSTGTLKAGTQPAVSVPATAFTLIGNPYASSIDFTKITKTKVPSRFYVWDPKRANSGAFVLFDGADGYEPMTKSGSYTGANTIIESGQAFFVEGSNDTGSIVISENSKSGIQLNAFRSSVDDGKLQVSLKGLHSDSTVVQLDEALTRYSNDYSAAINDEDAGKLNNFDESLSVLRGGKQLTVERRPVITMTDTVFLKIENTGVKKYQFDIAPANLDATVAAAYLEDLWLNTSTILSLTNSTVVPFSITPEVASADPNRFRIVLKTGRALPLQVTSVKAYQKDAGIRVDWNVESETNTNYYEVEKSANGQDFSKVGKVMATGNNGSTSSYNWLDPTPFNGNNFYRIKTVDRLGNVKVSEVVVVRITNEKKSIVIYPNPVTGRTILVQLTNQPKGEYILQLFNSLGQRLLNKTIVHNGGSATQTIQLGSIVSKGVYQLFITNGEDKISQQLIVQ